MRKFAKLIAKPLIGTLRLKKLLIIYPHFPPSNLAGVHRPRLFAQHLPGFGWEPVVLTVHEKWYEERPDHNLIKLLPPGLRVEKVEAMPVGRRRLVGDIGLRAFFQLYRRAKTLIQKEEIDFVLIPVPSFYCALLGRWLRATTGVKYGIDYIDPWVHFFPGSEKRFSRHWLSTKLANFLEPIAVKRASLVTGVAEAYYAGVLDRNPHLKETATFGAMPYGAEVADHAVLKTLAVPPYLFRKTGKWQLVYAGAMLPNAYGPLQAIFAAVAADKRTFANVEFHFIGTGKRADDPDGYSIRPLAEKYGLWQEVVFEYPRRIPYLDVLVHLSQADAIFILGSTEPHYTPSKTFQAVLSEKPVLAVLHAESSAVAVLRDARAGMVLDFGGKNDVDKIEKQFARSFREFRCWCDTFEPGNVDRALFETYSAKSVTSRLAALLDKASKKETGR